MSLVERFVGQQKGAAGKATTGTRPPAAPAAPQGDVVSLPTLREQSFRLDYAALRRQALISGSAFNRALTGQFGHARRRLMRELRLFKEGRGVAGGRRVLITSAHPGEGKTFTALNLALSTVLEERRPVLLVDADHVRAELGPRLSLPVARSGHPILYQAEDVPLRVLPAFFSSSQKIGAEGRRLMQELLDDLAARHPDALMLIDTPPLKALTDAAFAAQAVDHVVLVVGVGMTTTEDIETCMELIGRDVGTSVLLNRVRFDAERSHSYNDYDSYDAYRYPAATSAGATDD
jgi:Mrp family chromosome partitioning ATPase